MAVTDPVCGKQIDIDEAVAWEDRGGWLYFFCSPDRHRLFEKAPERYIHSSAPMSVRGKRGTRKREE